MREIKNISFIEILGKHFLFECNNYNVKYRRTSARTPWLMQTFSYGTTNFTISITNNLNVSHRLGPGQCFPMMQGWGESQSQRHMITPSPGQDMRSQRFIILFALDFVVNSNLVHTGCNDCMHLSAPSLSLSPISLCFPSSVHLQQHLTMTEYTY